MDETENFERSQPSGDPGSLSTPAEPAVTAPTPYESPPLAGAFAEQVSVAPPNQEPPVEANPVVAGPTTQSAVDQAVAPKRANRFVRSWRWLMLHPLAAMIVGGLLGAAVAGGSVAGSSSQVGATPPSISAPVYTPPVYTPPASTPTEEPELGSYIPKPSDFHLSLKILSKECFGSAGCNVTYRVKVGYSGLPLDEADTWEVTYTVIGDESGPKINTLTIEGEQVTTDEEEFASTRSSGTKLRVKVNDVSKLGI